MFNKKHIYSTVISLGLLLGTSQITVAKTPKPESPSQFQPIEQPLPLKIGVTLGGLALIGVEMWWFLFSKTKVQQAQTHHGLQELTITVDGGYTPDRIVVQAGKPVRLNFFRKDPSSCLEKVLLPDFHKAVDLVLNQTTPVEFTPQQPGNYTFHCGMNMFRGVVEVQDATDRAMPTSNHNGHVAVPEKPAITT
ncbi:MAG: cupredoxin domain-containing protein [Calothrix sp. MO_167.B12]|nr:cupredoxin domain-containing protein [Calothrix sp. MO_167.B12]